MRKRDWTAIAGLSVVFVAVLALGEMHSKQLQKKAYQAYLTYTQNHPTQNDSATGADNETEGSSPAPSTEPPASNGSTQGKLLADLVAAGKQNGKVHIVTIGGSAAKGVGVVDPNNAWFPVLVTKLQTVDGLNTLTGDNLAISGDSTTKLLSQSVIDEATNEKPDLILVETCAVSDWIQDVPLATSTRNLRQIVVRLQTALPNAHIVVMLPNPINSASANKLGLKYTDYVSQEQEYIQSQGWDYVDVYDAINQKLTDGTYSPKKLLPDVYHLNDRGYQIWADTVLNYLNGM